MLKFATSVALVSLAVAIVLCLVRLWRGPDAGDRIIAFDTLYINTVAMLIVLGIHLSSVFFFEAAVLIALTGFIGTAALARYAARGDVVE